MSSYLSVQPAHWQSVTDGITHAEVDLETQVFFTCGSDAELSFSATLGEIAAALREREPAVVATEPCESPPSDWKGDCGDCDHHSFFHSKTGVCALCLSAENVADTSRALASVTARHRLRNKLSGFGK